MQAKNLIKSFAIFLLLTIGILTVIDTAYAQTIFDDTSGILNKTGLPSFAGGLHEKASIEEGADSITSALFLAIDFIKYGIGAIAVLYIIISGLRLLTAGAEVSEESEALQRNLKYVIFGLIVIIIADEVVSRVVFGLQGESISSEASAKLFAQQGSKLVLGIARFLEAFVGVVAVLMIVISGFRLISDPESEDQVTKATKHITWSVIGLIIVGISEVVVRIFYGEAGEGIDVKAGKELIAKIAEFVSSFVGIAALLALVYGGYMYVSSFGDEDGTGKAKKIVIYALVGLLIAAGAFALTTTLVTLT